MLQLLIFIYGARLPTHDLFLAILGRPNQVDSLDMADIDLVTQDVSKDDFGEVFLPLIAVQVALYQTSQVRSVILVATYRHRGSHP